MTRLFTMKRPTLSLGMFIVVASLVSLTAGVAMGQPAAVKSKPVKPQSGKSKADAKEEDPALKPRREILKTKDNVKINAFYFPSALGKKAVPVVVVHEWRGQAGPYMRLFLSLREAGFAVVALEYRGHGNSKKYTDRRGIEKDYNIATMGRRDVEAVIRYDIEEVKHFLKTENNEGRLNLNALSMVGIGEGAIMAGYWASRDWKMPSVGRIKQGQDVKALVYVSPEKNLNGMAMAIPMKDPNLIRLPTLMIAGKDSPQGKETEQLGNRLEIIKKKLNRGTATGYELVLANTSLSTAALMAEEATVIPKIVSFLKANVIVSKAENPWVDRP